LFAVGLFYIQPLSSRLDCPPEKSIFKVPALWQNPFPARRRAPSGKTSNILAKIPHIVLADRETALR